MAIVLIFRAYKISNEEDIYEDHIKHTFGLVFFLIHRYIQIPPNVQVLQAIRFTINFTDV